MKTTVKKGKILKIMSVILFFAGILVLLYPYVGQYLYKQDAQKRITGFSHRMEQKNKGDWDRLYQLMVEYNKKLYRDGQKNLVDAFSYQQVDFSLKQFGFDEEMIGYLSIHQMDIRLPVYLGANLENMRKGATHLTQTSLPVGGNNTNAVIAAHRGMSTAAMFRDIEKLKTGDEITMTNFRETLTYRVAEIKVINPNEINQILIQKNRDLLTLITCHPYRYNYKRYVVYCERTDGQ